MKCPRCKLEFKNPRNIAAGKRTSHKKAIAARLNGRKGGRPSKHAAAQIVALRNRQESAREGSPH